MKVKLAILLLALLVVLGVVGGTVYLSGSNGISAKTAGVKVATQFNAVDTQNKLVKVLRCVKGLALTEWICAGWVLPTSDANLYAEGMGALISTKPTCAVVVASVTAKKTVIVSGIADPPTCLFA